MEPVDGAARKRAGEQAPATANKETQDDHRDIYIYIIMIYYDLLGVLTGFINIQLSNQPVIKPRR